MRFDLYPLDEHICKFRVGSTNLDITRMRFDETKKSYDPTKRNTILDYAVEINQLNEDDRYVLFNLKLLDDMFYNSSNYQHLTDQFLNFVIFFIRILRYGALGNFSITGIEISFIRHKFKYIYVYYLPSGLFVIVSWVSFLIPPEVIPGRMAMLITLFLVLINIFNVSLYE